MDMNYLLFYASSATAVSAGLLLIAYLFTKPGLWRNSAPQARTRSDRTTGISGHMVRRGKLNFNPIIGCAMPYYSKLG